MTQNDESRKAFETVAESHGYNIASMGGIGYTSKRTNQCWRSWQASESRTEAKYAELVSVLESIRSECSNWKKYSGKQPRWDCDAPETVKAVDALAAEALSRIQKGGS